MRWATLILGTLGGLGCGHLGAAWLREGWRLSGNAELAAAVGHDPALTIVSALALVVAMVFGLAGAVLAHNGSARLSSALLVAAGLAPGLLDPRAFVVGSVLCLAGLLALGLPGPDAGLHAVAAPRPSLLHDEPAEVLSGVRRASVG